MKLAANATYVSEGDAIIADIYLLEEVLSKYVPNLIAEGLVQVLYNNNIIETITFDRRMGNSDGAVKLWINHPTLISGMSLKISVDIIDSDEHFEIIIPVLNEAQATTGGEIPLVPQPGTTNIDYMSRKTLQNGQ